MRRDCEHSAYVEAAASAHVKTSLSVTRATGQSFCIREQWPYKSATSRAGLQVTHGNRDKHPGRNVRSRESEANQEGKGGSSQKTTLDLLYRLEWNLRPQTGASAATPIETPECQTSRTVRVDKNIDARRRARRFANAFHVTLLLVFTEFFTGKPGKKLSFPDTVQDD